ncbi:recombinase family protein [Roseomonas sp. NAR14]|uniref:Recombinase family protein n=1 Tax=Roseomonas acroporae TaxID=2937791 RepID=A0A9X2BZR0_9PROT|nr:recombinase family protein [Roseomonas acroporae]
MSVQARDFVPYLRVSTDRQGRSGLGLEAQEAAIAGFIAQTPGARLLVPPFVEVESGRKADRPKLAEALEKCRRTGATLLVAKLDRLARNARFLLTVVEGTGEGGVAFLDLPTIPAGPVGKFLLTQMAAVSELEAGLIGQRTRAALAAAKARGKTLGGVRPGQRLPDQEAAEAGRRSSLETRQREADRAAHRAARRMTELRDRGMGLQGIARMLNEAGERTVRGGVWTATAVKRVLERVGAV